MKLLLLLLLLLPLLLLRLGGRRQLAIGWDAQTGGGGGGGRAALPWDDDRRRCKLELGGRQSKSERHWPTMANAASQTGGQTEPLARSPLSGLKSQPADSI